MSDLISRKAAIDSICRTVCDNPEICESPCDEIKVLETMPSAQPETHEKRTETHSCDLISRKAAIDAVDESLTRVFVEHRDIAEKMINKIPSAQPENQVHLCDSCRHVFPECPSEEDDVIYGNGKGNDNICACNKYEPSAQPERQKGHWIRHPEQRNIFNGKTIECSECHEKYTVQYVEDELFCRHCGAEMTEDEGCRNT